MDLSKFKKVGTASDGEPIYEISSTAQLSRFAHSCADPDCLACIFNKLIDPVEELDVWLERAMKRLQFLHDVPQSHRHERQMLRRKYALASESLSNLKAMVLTAAKVLHTYD